MTTPNRDPANRCLGSGAVLEDADIVNEVAFCKACGRPVSVHHTGVKRIVPHHGTFITKNTKHHDDLLRTRRSFA